MAGCVDQISELNPYTKIGTNEADLSTVDLSLFDQFTVIVSLLVSMISFSVSF